MDEKRNSKRGRLNGNILLLTVLIGFCILALIEIIYGHAQMKVEKERLELEQANNQAVAELKEQWDELQGNTTVEEQEADNDQTASGNADDSAKVSETGTETAKAETQAEDEDDTGVLPDEDKDYDMQIVILGDSIMDNNRTESGIAPIISEQCNAKVYNMAMGGTTAALMPTEQYNYATWDSRCLLGVVNAILGNINTDIFDDYPAGEILKECDFSETDYFILEYGVNDFLTGQIPESRYLEGGDTLAVDAVHTYTGALENAVMLLQDNFPDAKILLIAPHYCQIYNDTTFVGDGYSVDYGWGPLINFARGTGYIYEQHKSENVLFFNAFEDSGINAETADKYLADGVHLTPEGNRVYAEYVARILNKDFRPEE
jgi:lysophospholipase L1-like esterase